MGVGSVQPNPQCRPWRPMTPSGVRKPLPHPEHLPEWDKARAAARRELSSDARRPRYRVSSAVNEAIFPLHGLTNVLQPTAGIARVPNLGQPSEPPRPWAKAVPSSPCWNQATDHGRWFSGIPRPSQK